MWNDSKPPKMVHKLTRNGPKMVPTSPNWSQMVQSSPNSITNLLKEKNVGVTHEKMGIWPQKPCFSEVLGIKCPFFHLQCPFIFSEEMPNSIKNLIKEKKVGVTHEKMGIWPQKWLEKGQNSWWWAIKSSRMVKSNLD